MDEITVRLNSDTMHWWLSLPATEEALNYALGEMNAAIGDIRIDRCRDGLGGKLEHLVVGAEIAEANYLAMRLTELTPGELRIISAAMEQANRPKHIESLIDLTYNLDAFQLAEYSGEIDLSHSLGVLTPTSLGFLIPTNHHMRDDYAASGHIPDAYRIMPQTTWRQRLDRNTADGYPQLYPYSKAVAWQNGDIDLYNQSLTMNIRCVEAIEQAMGGTKHEGAFHQVIEQFGCSRVSALLAHTLREGYDNLAPEYKSWALSIRSLPTNPDGATLIVDVPLEKLEFCIQVIQREQANQRVAVEASMETHSAIDPVPGTPRNKPSVKDQIRAAQQTKHRTGNQPPRRHGNRSDQER